jgi:hypothetical protein
MILFAAFRVGHPGRSQNNLMAMCREDLSIQDIIDRHYDDQLNQAAGRNRGFRLSEKRPTTTRVITSPRLWQQVLRKRQDRHRRVQLYIADNPNARAG